MIKNNKFLLLVIFSTFLVISCDRTPVQRQYTQIFMESQEAKSVPAGHPPVFSQNMPQDDIHKNVNMDQMGMPTGQQAALDESVDRRPLAWTTPDGWTEQAGSGMRMATFKNADGANPVTTTIVSLGGSAGGMAANVERWMRQIGLSIPENDSLENFLARQESIKTASGLSAIMIDLTEWQKNENPDVPSMVAAVIERDGAQIFIKMTGSKQAVNVNKASFKSLVSSIQTNN